MQEKQYLTPYLFLLSDSIEKNRSLIAREWTKVDTVKSVFNFRKISSKKFRDSFGIPIIEYFISVVREENELGDCPVMTKLVNYLVNKDITPREVFDICMGFRRVLVAFLISKKAVQKNPEAFLEEVAIVFDANLSGVLEIFTSLYAKAQKKIEIAKVHKDKLQQTLKIINSINTKIIIVQNGRIILANKPFLEMTGVKDLKSLYLKYNSGFDFLNEVNINEDVYKVDIPKWIKSVCKNNKPFQSEIYNKQLKKTFNYSGRITKMPVEEAEQYIITFNNISDHIKDEQNLQDTLTHDELTGFRNYPTFEHFLAKMIEEAKKENSRMFLAIVDIPYLQDINNNEGIDAGNLVISEVAENLRFLVDKNINFGRLDGSRFGVVIDYKTEQDSYDWCVKLFQRMKDSASKKTLAITEVDLTESINKLFLRAYDLIEQSNNSEDSFVFTDFKNIIEHKELQDQREFTGRLAKFKTLNMTLYYMELPIAYEAQILSTKKDSIKITLSDKQAKIAKENMAIYFTLEYIGSIKAYIKDINVDKRVAIINRFRIDKHTPLNRKVFRIEAEEGIKAYITDNNRDYDVKVLNMNSDYITVEIDRKRNFDINNLVYIDMLLSISDIADSLATNATVTRIDKIAGGGYKMVLLCHLDDESRGVLSKYMAKRQIDIIHNFQI